MSELDPGFPPTDPDSKLAGRLESLAANTSRRGFLSRTAAALFSATAGGSLVAKAINPGEADAFHFCGHIFTTDSCPHPAGAALPRIDRRGFPLDGSSGRPVDNLGRFVNGKGEPVDGSGDVLRDADGRPLPPAPRTPVCDEVARKFGMKTWIDGGWYRCCGGNVRKLVDCCSYNNKRINGDASLQGYCYQGRKVFCVMYFDTNVPC